MRAFQYGLLTLALATSGCASIVSKSSYPVSVSSEPSGATVLIKNKKGEDIHKGTTPFTVTLPSGQGYFGPGDYILDYNMDGYQPKHTVMQAGLNGWYIGNFCLAVQSVF